MELKSLNKCTHVASIFEISSNGKFYNEKKIRTFGRLISYDYENQIAVLADVEVIASTIYVSVTLLGSIDMVVNSIYEVTGIFKLDELEVESRRSTDMIKKNTSRLFKERNTPETHRKTPSSINNPSKTGRYSIKGEIPTVLFESKDPMDSLNYSNSNTTLNSNKISRLLLDESNSSRQDTKDETIREPVDLLNLSTNYCPNQNEDTPQLINDSLIFEPGITESENLQEDSYNNESIAKLNLELERSRFEMMSGLSPRAQSILSDLKKSTANSSSVETIPILSDSMRENSFDLISNESRNEDDLRSFNAANRDNVSDNLDYNMDLELDGLNFSVWECSMLHTNKKSLILALSCSLCTENIEYIDIFYKLEALRNKYIKAIDTVGL